jgi:hypothetical protein
MVNIKVDTNKKIKNIKPMHAVGQPPFGGGFLKFDFSPIEHLKNANIPYSRLHDVNGAFGGNRFVDIPNIFRDFDADENDPASYDFAFTDVLIEAMYSYEVKPIFRLGVTIENQCNIKSYTIDPPKDFSKWARICEHIIRHYNEGWADGYTYGIEYWEIWNEPDNPKMWTGSFDEFYDLYVTTARHLKSCFPNLKIGGYSSSGFYTESRPLEECGAWFKTLVHERWQQNRMASKLRDLLKTVDPTSPTAICNQYKTNFDDNYKKWKVWGTKTIEFITDDCLAFSNHNDAVTYFYTWMESHIEYADSQWGKPV